MNVQIARNPKTRRRVLGWAAILAAVLCLVAAGLWISGRPGPANAESAAIGQPTPSGSSAAAPSPTTHKATAATSAKGSPSAATTPKAATTPSAKKGTIAELAKISQTVLKPVQFDHTSKINATVTSGISELKSVTGVAQGIGEVAGPSIQFKVTLKNDTSAAISTADVVVNVNYGTQNTPAIALSGPGVTQFPTTVAANGSTTATYVFTVPTDQRSHVQILVNYEASSPIAAFEGAAPNHQGTR